MLLHNQSKKQRLTIFLLRIEKTEDKNTQLETTKSLGYYPVQVALLFLIMINF